MTEQLYLVIDQGSQSSRSIVFDARGRKVEQAVQKISVIHNDAGFIEHDPDELLNSVRNTIADVVSLLGKRAKNIVAAGLATQRSSIACWHKVSGRPLSAVISWQDRRAHAEVEKLKPYAETIHDKTGLFLTPHYGASKLHWCLENIPEVRKAQEEGCLCFGPLASFLLYALLDSHPHVIDPANGSRTQLMNIKTRDWDPDLLKLFQVPRLPLPRCVPTMAEYGDLVVGDLRIPFSVCTGDQNAAIFAHGGMGHNAALVNIGTGAFVLRPTGSKRVPASRLLTSIALQTEKEVFYVLEGTVNGAGCALSWAESVLEVEYLVDCLADWIREEQKIPLFLNGISGLGAPFWVPDFKSRFIGEGTDRAKAVAVAESILFLIRTNLDEMAKYVAPPERLVVSGGVAANDALCQRLADLVSLPVYRPGACEATARGLAFLCAGQPRDWAQLGDAKCFLPLKDQPVQERYRQWRSAMPDTI